MTTRLFFLLCLPALALPAVTAAPAPSESPRFDWPQWRGPDRTDVSKETGLLKDWPEDGPKLLWSYEEAGVGYSGPAIVGDKYLTMGADEKQEFVLCLNATSGKKLWSTQFGPRANKQPQYGEGPRATPTVDGDRVYALGAQGILVCLELGGGKKVWEKGLVQELQGGIPTWDYSESPLVDGDKVVVTPGGSKGAIAALDKKTGDVLWRSKGFTDGAQYGSLMIGHAGGVKQYVQMTGSSVAGVAAADGRLLWQFARQGRIAAVPSVIVKDDFVFASSGYGAGCSLIKLTRDGDKFKADEVYANKDMTNHHGGVVLVGDYLYGYSDKGGWVCMEFKTGRVAWSGKKLGKGSLTCADGMLYLYDENNGTCALIEASPAGWKEHGRFRIPKEAKGRPGRAAIRTHPVVANGRLYLRDQELIFAFDVKAATSAQ
jgi:outer membrane protein assembly factor BamB